MSSRGFNIEINQADIERIRFMTTCIKNGAETVIMRSVNKTLSSTKVIFRKETQKVLNLKVARINKDMVIHKATKTRLKADVTSKGKPIGLMNFIRTRQTTYGTSVSVRKDTPRKIIQGAFIAKGKNNNTHVFWRRWHTFKAYKGKKMTDRMYASMPRRYRFKIDSRFGPRIQDIQDDPQVYNPAMKAASEILVKNFKHELEWFLRVYRGR